MVVVVVIVTIMELFQSLVVLLYLGLPQEGTRRGFSVECRLDFHGFDLKKHKKKG